MDDHDLRLADLAVAKGAATRSEADEALEAVRQAAGQGQAASIAEILVARGVLTREEADALDTASRTSATPNRLAGFELLGRLGTGGMGTVLKARQISLNRFVALKILPKRLAQDKAFVQRFLREARSAARLRHPHIVRAFDVGRAGGHYYFAMEFVDGEGLDAILEQDGPLEQNRALAVMKQVCSAVAAAHKAGIVHRDIKPSNILIDREGEVRVTDFGLAKLTEGDIAVTADGQTLGTPAYMSPEAARGREADARSDLYSLGATAFHLLAGRPPFEGRTYSEVLIKQATAAPPPLAELAPHVDRRLCRIIDRLLRKAPAQRYPSADALLADLDALGELAPPAEPERKPPPARTTRRLARARRRRLKGSHVAALSAAALLAAAGVLWLLSRETPGPTATRAPRSQPPPRVVAPSPRPTSSQPTLVSDARRPLFDGQSLRGWRVAEGGDCQGHGPVRVADGRIVLEKGKSATGIVSTERVPRIGYELELEAMRLADGGMVCGVVFPIDVSHCELDIGGGDGTVIALSQVDGREGSDNSTTTRAPMASKQWHAVRLRVTGEQIRAWVDDKRVMELPVSKHDCTLSRGRRPLTPLGIFGRGSTSAVRRVRLRELEGAAMAAGVPASLKGEAVQARPTGGGGGGPFADNGDGTGVLVGFEHSLGGWAGHRILKAVRPVFRTPEGPKAGTWHGRAGGYAAVLARPGYAVGGMTTRSGMRVDGFQLTFMRVRGDRLDPGDSYQSAWVGGRGGGPIEHGGSGNPIIGVHGRHGSDLDALGLVELRPAGGASTP